MKSLIGAVLNWMFSEVFPKRWKARPTRSRRGSLVQRSRKIARLRSTGNRFPMSSEIAVVNSGTVCGAAGEQMQLSAVLQMRPSSIGKALELEDVTWRVRELDRRDEVVRTSFGA
jgi:hypothetical protein